MRALFLATILLVTSTPAVVAQPHAVVQAVPLANVKWTTGFWADRFETCRTVMIPTMAKIMTGTDLGGIWIIPGFSLHQEFRELSNAGFTPLEILQATTLNGARFLNRESTMGTVEVNKNADLVLLDANPVLNVANLSKIAGVFNAGKYFSKSDLDALKAGVAGANAVAPMRDVSTVLDPSHKD